MILPRPPRTEVNVISLQDHDSTCGLAQFLEKPAAKDGVLVKVLKAQGAIPFVKTNIPQTLLRSLKWEG